MVADLGANAIPMILENGIGYIPLATFSDIFCNAFGLQIFYNGINAFFSGAQRASLNDLYYEARLARGANPWRISPITSSASMAISTMPSKRSMTSPPSTIS